MEKDGTSVGSPLRGQAGRSQRTLIRLLGKVEIVNDGIPVALPPSRKVRALLACLALSPRPLLRLDLCDLLWDSVSDPRGELRWCLSKLRHALGGRASALVSDGQWISLDCAAVDVDARAFLAGAERVRENGNLPALRGIDALHTGDLLADLGAGVTPRFDNWLDERREVFSAALRSILRRMAELLMPDDPERIRVLRRLIDRSPYDDGAHGELLRSLVARRRHADARRHLDATRLSYRAEGLGEQALLHFWRRLQRDGAGGTSAMTSADAHDVTGGGLAPDPNHRGRPMVAIVPFAASDPNAAEHARNLTHDVTIGLARLRSPFVISQCTSFALAERGLSASEIGDAVAADYVVTGTIRRDRGQLGIALDLVEAGTDRLIWSENFSTPLRDTPDAAGEMGSLITAALMAEIELTECRRATEKSPGSLDAWEAHHRGLWHLHRFTRKDNEIAIGYFNRAASLEPALSRCFAGLSYAHWMNAFAFRTKDSASELNLALDAAGRGLHADPKDPAALWAMSRALWMSKDEDGAARAIERAIDLSPSFALARHSRSFCECQTGDAARAISDSQLAERLSPFDPWRYAMHGVQAFGNLRLGEMDKAAEAARRLTGMPNAHVQARGLAVLVLAACGQIKRAKHEVAVVRKLRPSYCLRDFFHAYHVTGELRQRLVGAGLEAGLQE